MKILPVILSGGAGTRLWPLSREHYPKQLLALAGEHSLLQQTVQRLDGLDALSTDAEVVQTDPPMIICNETHRFLVAEQMRQLDRAPGPIVLEPIGRNTAPALTVAALLALQGGDDVMLVMPADHVIRDLATFHHAVLLGSRLASEGRLVTFGIVPDQPHTGYGYIRKGQELDLKGDSGVAYVLDAFVEKPDQATAEGYLQTGEYVWNSGMFLMRASVWMEQIERYRPDIASACSDAVKGGGRDGEFFRVDKEAFAACPSDSIDYAVMEKVVGEEGGKGAEAVVIPLQAGWSDIGAWPALWEVREKDGKGNVLRGDIMTHDTSNSMVLAEHRFVAGVGLEDIVVVETSDAVLVAHKDRAQDVKVIVNELKARKRPETEMHRRVYRPWGFYEEVDSGDRFQVKRIMVNSGASLSLQMHMHRAEHWVVVKGTARVTRGEEEFLLAENQSTYIPVGVKHRLFNPGTLPLELIEVQSGSYLGEDDIVRFEDEYGRT